MDLGDDVVALSPPTHDDVDRITALCQDPEIQGWTVIPSPYPRDAAVWFLEHVVDDGWESGANLTWGIRAEGELVGMIGLTVEPLGSAEVGYWLGPDARGRGLLHRALGLVLDHAFDPAGVDLDVVEWRAYAGNWASWRTAWRHGFRFEGVHRLGAVQRDRRRDDWAGSLLRSDPRTPVAPWPATEAFGLQPPDHARSAPGRTA